MIQKEKDFDEALKATFRQPATRLVIPKIEDPYNRFFFLLLQSDCPSLHEFWDQDEKKCDEQGLLATLPSLNHGENIMARFLMAVWFSDKREFDIREAAATLDLPRRRLIAEWLSDPFWP
ncbi:hypothetical protein Xmau_03816 [Xenorhabdus mauleonii]|uniref:Uncharacterized protein n=1 Tax=Xenorhabdus mauleonii TaxID=351675 RepID=A0A1I3V4U9_9GAMM|nr:hypothetical protein [Xenorhabdus mauleonii]PHM37599.1 hypothetical protein Xmau_03816 [Xenorhabdus mauleonii]SFJ89366.1 hypothetical protein SAMN05421680_11921 [Xenorhabdus mauleonii]